MPREHREIHRQFKAAEKAYRSGDLEGLRNALGNPPDFPNCMQPFDLGMGDDPLGYAIYWSPLAFIAQLLDVGADPNYPDPGGFPSLIAALSSERKDKHELLALLLARGASVLQRGHNDWTPLHYAVVQRDLKSIHLLIEHGADATARTRIDDCTTPIEDAAAVGFVEAVALMQSSGARA
jgi:ankyrin repeat protein